ncbi:Molybdate-anion transporter, partial [Linum perenne]
KKLITLLLFHFSDIYIHTPHPLFTLRPSFTLSNHHRPRSPPPEAGPMEIFYFLVFGGLSAIVAVLEFSKNNKDRVSTSPAFNSFKNNYLVVYSLMMAGDWLQGPYVYYLYTVYGYGKGDIGQLFIAGFGSSMLFGTIVGSLADKQGRKRAAVTYCITYILSCITKHSPQYKVLMLGRVLGGIATSLLFSAFESWLVAEHFKRNFDQQWLSVTFSKAIFLGNGLVAIVAGLFGNVLVDTLALGPVAPFDAAACFLAIGMAIIISTWPENYGDPSENKDLLTQFKGAAIAIASGETLLWIHMYFLLVCPYKHYRSEVLYYIGGFSRPFHRSYEIGVPFFNLSWKSCLFYFLVTWVQSVILLLRMIFTL